MARLAYYVLGLCVLFVLTGAIGSAQELKLFPGSQLDEKASREASQAAPGKESQVYTTSESFDKVYAFYKSLYKQDTKMRAGGPTLPSGQQVQWAFFLIDGGSSLASSKYWMKVQYPYVGGSDGKDIRNVTIIQSVRTK
jgi:hypothetical protein